MSGQHTGRDSGRLLPATGRPTELIVDGVCFTVSFSGFNEPLDARLGERRARLHPWTWNQHLAALGRHAHVADGELALDARGFASEIVTRSGEDAAQLEWLHPLALWWAAGGHLEPAPPRPDGWLHLHGHRVRLRPWTWGERATCLERHVRATVTSADERGVASSDAFDIAGYLAEMTRACIARVESDQPVGARSEEADASDGADGAGERPFDLDALDSAATSRLLAAVEDINGRPGIPPSADIASRVLAICRALGWTPSRVWSAPAAEIDALLELLRVSATGPAHPAAAPARTSELSAYPDAVVIHFTQDEDP